MKGLLKFVARAALLPAIGSTVTPANAYIAENVAYGSRKDPIDHRDGNSGRDIRAADDSRPRHTASAQLVHKYSLASKLVLALIQVDSAYQTDALSLANTRCKMQPSQDTTTLFWVRDALNPTDNIHDGMRHLGGMMKRLKGEVTKTSQCIIPAKELWRKTQAIQKAVLPDLNRYKIVSTEGPLNAAPD